MIYILLSEKEGISRHFRRLCQVLVQLAKQTTQPAKLVPAVVERLLQQIELLHTEELPRNTLVWKKVTIGISCKNDNL